jgi:transposase
MKSLQTSDQVSISKEKTCFGWWTQSCVEMSQKLWSPTEIDYVDSHTNLLNGYVTGVKPLSWSNIKSCKAENRNFPKISWPSSMCSAADITDSEDTKVQKIKLKPTTKQAVILRTWMKAARDTYNLGLNLVKRKLAKPNLALKKLVVTANENDSVKIKKMKETPADIRVGAVRDLIKTYNTAWAGFKQRIQKQKTSKKRWNKKKKQEKMKQRRRWNKVPFDVKFKSRRMTQDSFAFEQKSIKVENDNLFLFSAHNKFKMKEPIKMSHELTHHVSTDCRISYSFGRWYVLVPFKENRPHVSTITEPKVVALDPGVRSFSSYFSSDGRMGEIGTNMQEMALKLKNKISSIRDQIKETVGQKKKRLKKAWYRLNARSANLATDFHCHTIKFLLDEFDVVISPKLAVSFMVSDRNDLNKNSKATMLFQRHSEFQNKLRMKAAWRRKIVLDLEEHGTSMTCSSCGNIKTDLGDSKLYSCVFCGLVADRDLNAAKNHLMKAAVGKVNY